MENVLTIWMAFALWLRLPLLLLLFFFLLGIALRKLGPKLFKVVTYFIESFFYVIFTFCIIFATPFINWKVKRGKKNFTLLGKFENRSQRIVSFFKQHRTKNYLIHKDSKGFRKYLIATRLAIVAFGAILLFLPDSIVSTKADDWERWAIEEKLHVSRIHHEEAWAVMKSWNETVDDKMEADVTTVSTADEENVSPILYKLDDNRGGGTIRKEPVENLNIQNTATTIGPQDIITYLNEEKTLGGIRWLKVEAPNGVIGWISSNIIKEVE